jgi:hypothetical protein
MTGLAPLQQPTPTAVQAAAPVSPGVPSLASTSTAGSESAQAASGAHKGYNAAHGVVADNELASNVANDIMKQKSPLMERARAVAGDYVAGRGMTNSSIAAGAAMGAMVDRALPLAQQDAAARRNQALYNTDATNRAAEFEAGAFNTKEQANADRTTNVSVANADNATKVNLANSEAQNRALMQQAIDAAEAQRQHAALTTQTNISNADAQNRLTETAFSQNAETNRQWMAGSQAKELADIQGKYQQLIATNEAASSLYQSHFQSISAAMANDSIPPDRIAQYVRVQQSMLENGLKVIDALNGIDLNTEAGPPMVPIPTGGGNITMMPAGTPDMSMESAMQPGGSAALPTVPTALQAPNRQLLQAGFIRYDPVSGELVNPQTGERRVPG